LALADVVLTIYVMLVGRLIHYKRNTDSKAWPTVRASSKRQRKSRISRKKPKALRRDDHTLCRAVSGAVNKSIRDAAVFCQICIVGLDPGIRR